MEFIPAFQHRRRPLPVAQRRAAGLPGHRQPGHLEQAYDGWVANREPPLFGAHPDARVLAVAAERTGPILDIGAGTGRNAFALARRGHQVDAVEPTTVGRHPCDPGWQESLNIRVIQAEAFAGDVYLRSDYSMTCSPGWSRVRAAQLRALFELATRSLAPGGELVFNTFLARHDYLDRRRAAVRPTVVCVSSPVTGW